MAARVIWKGVLRCDDFRLPVKFYSAAEDKSIHFNLLHDQDMVRLTQQLVNSSTGRPVAYADTQKGYEVESGLFVLLSAEELAELEPKFSRDVTLTRFVHENLINHQWYDRPYFLGPDGDEEDYFAFAAALEREEREAVAQWVMRKKEYRGALRAQDGYLVMITLRPAAAIIAADQLEPPSGRKLDAREQKLAEQLLAALAGEFDPGEFHDEYRGRVMQLIEAKAKGGTIEVEEYEEKPADDDSLLNSLQASLAGAK